MAGSIRSGRVTITKNTNKIVIAGSKSGNKTAMYRFYNSGKEGESIQIDRSQGTGWVNAVATGWRLDWKDSVDIAVGKENIRIFAGASKDAEVVYEFLGLTD